MKVLVLVFALAVIACAQADDCNCRLKTKNRIVNGEIAVEHSIPWIVSLAVNDWHICGASIMNERFILTAAHCTDQVDIESLTARVGIHNKQEEIPKDQIYSVKKVHVKKYKDVNSEGDIAIIELNKKITFVDGVIEKGCFNLDKRNYPNSLLAAGWGRTEMSYKNMNEKKLVLNGLGTNLKQAFFNQELKCKDYLICFKPVNKGDSACQGDSGGPIHYTENGITTVEGVFSFTKGEQRGETIYHCVGYGGYSRLSYYADWISKTAEYNFCGAKEKKKFLGLF